MNKLDLKQIGVKELSITDKENTNGGSFLLIFGVGFLLFKLGQYIGHQIMGD